MSASLDIVIVNWNSGGHLRRCIEGITRADRNGFSLERVVVVDNASCDSSTDEVGGNGLPLTLILNRENVGFAAACNQGAKDSKADYVLFLNPDVVLFENSVTAPLRFLEDPRNDQVGICGIQLLDERGRVSPTCSRFPDANQFYSRMFGFDRLFPKQFPPTLMIDWLHDESREVDQVMGAFMLVRHPVFKLLSGFDEQFFVYFEDVDLPYRASRSGWKCYYLVEAQAQHCGHGCTAQASATSLFYILRSRILYGYKHFTWLEATGVFLGTMLIEPLPRLVSAVVTRESFANVPATLRAYAMLWYVLPGIFQRSLRALRAKGLPVLEFK